MSTLLKTGRKLIFGIGLAGCGAAAALLLGLTEERRVARASSLLGNGFYNPNGPPSPLGPKWDYNWDKREPYSLVKTPLKGTFKTLDDENRYNEKVEKAKAVATRHLLLIRHGQYLLNGQGDGERHLTPLGKDQSKYIGLRLRELNLPYTRVIQSTMTRAAETAEIIRSQLNDGIPFTSCDFLREGAPFPPVPASGTWRPDKQQFHEDGSRIEAAFRKYFHRASPNQEKDSYEIMVCHANVIRYFICRALQFPPEAWLRFSLHNCSLTWISIKPSGRVIVHAVGDMGHIPPSKLTTN